MAPNTHFEFIIVRLSFSKNLTPDNPRMSVIRRKPNLSGSTIIGDWIDLNSRAAIVHLSAQTFSYCEWRIMSGNVQLFTVDDHRYDKIFLFLGEEQLHWTFYHNNKKLGRISSISALNFSYCPCCLNSHYEEIISAVKENLKNNIQQ